MKNKVIHTDPTYLRTVHDGLLTGSVHKENSSALPQGLVGMYEEALPPAANVNERKKFMEFFAMWALLKKEVSAEFVLPLLEGWAEDQVIDYIAKYSKWFNSPESGKYVLYHERLRTFILQKESTHHFEKCNEQIIHQCQIALQAKDGDEWDRYALEYLSTHLLIQAMDSQDGETLKSLSYNTSHWNRQVEISKGFEWSKRMLNDMMLWASKYNDDEVIECALNKVDLHHLEQSDAPRIVEVVAQNDIETALQRIESFGGNDKEGLQRKFILYMLCLMELTLLDSKDKPFRKEAIEKLLKHLDDNLPVDHSVLNWNNFFSSYLLFQMACRCEEIGIDYIAVYKRTFWWDFDWVAQQGPYSRLEFNVLLNSAIGTESCSSVIIKELAKQGYFLEALNLANNICDDELKSLTLANISTSQANSGLLESAFHTMEVALKCARGITDIEIKSISLIGISGELALQGKLKDSNTLLENTIVFVGEISDDYEKSNQLELLCIKLAEQGAFELALSVVKAIEHEEKKVRALFSISSQLTRHGHTDKASQIINEATSYIDNKSDDIDYYWFGCIADELLKQDKIDDALEVVNRICDKEEMDQVLVDIAIQIAELGFVEKAIDSIKEIKSAFERFRFTLALHSKLNMPGKLEEAQLLAEGLDDPYSISLAKCKISSELTKQNVIKKAGNLMQEALKSAFSISYNDEWNKCRILKVLSIELARQGNIKASFDCFREGGNFFDSNGVLCSVNSEYALKGMFREISFVFQEALSKVSGVIDPFERVKLLFANIKNLLRMGMAEEAILLACGLKDEEDRNRALEEISIGFIDLCLMDKAIACAYRIDDNNRKSYALWHISIELDKQGHLEQAESVMQDAVAMSDDRDKCKKIQTLSVILVKKGHKEEALDCAREISSDDWKSSALVSISAEMFKLGQVEEAASTTQEAFECAREISNERRKSFALKNISTNLAKQGQVEEATSAIQEALVCARGISDESDKSSALSDISTELAKQGQVLEALVCAREISSDRIKISALKDISIELTKQGLKEEAASAMEEALVCARGISDQRDKSSALKDISSELAKQCKVEEAVSAIQEALGCARGISGQRDKSYALKDISAELAKQGKVEEAASAMQESFDCARMISDNIMKSSALVSICIELVKQGQLEASEAFGLEISHGANRESCWKQIAIANFETKSWKLALQGVQSYKNDEARIFYLKGWSEHVAIENVTAELISEALPFIANDGESIELLLQKYALKETLLGSSEESLVRRLNRTLNIQWALDVKNSFSAD